MAERARGALLRAMELRADDVVDEVCAAIDEDFNFHAEAFAWASREPITALKVATVIAHNLGDLSRVVEEWTLKTPQAQSLAARYARLGHENETRYDGLFARVGSLNKAVMALENHRFLPLRAARGLRESRALLLPIGPFFDAWGAVVARHPTMETAERASAVSALLECHIEGPTQQGCLRALAGAFTGPTRAGSTRSRASCRRGCESWSGEGPCARRCG